MATFWEKATRSVHYVLFVLCLLVISVSHFGIEGGSFVVLSAPVPGHCLTFTLKKLQNFSILFHRKVPIEKVWHEFFTCQPIFSF